jgi:hypothetical protein
MPVKFFSSWLFVLSITALLCSACGAASAANATAGVNSGETLFKDDFTNPNSGWGLWSKEGALVEYHPSGGLRILVTESQYDFWSVSGRQFSDVQVEVDAMLIGGPVDNDFGLICRYKDENNFYMLIISSDGYYGIAKMKDGQYSMIGSDQLQYSSVIAQGQSTNRLRGDCVGQRLVLFVNDQKLMEAADSDFTSGDVGLLAGAYDEPNVDIMFNNFVVKKP